MNPDLEMVPQLTAEETIACAIESAKEFDVSVVPDKNRPDFELVTLQSCFARIGEIAADPRELAAKITSCLRKYSGAGLSKIAAPAAEIAQILIDCVSIDGDIQSVLPLASIQIAASGLSLIKKNPEFERLISSCDVLHCDEHDRRQIAAIITALAPCSNENLTAQRWQSLAPNCKGFALQSFDELQTFLLFADASLSSFNRDAGFLPARRLSLESADPENAAKQLISSVMHSPAVWIYELYKKSSNATRHAIYMIMAGKLSRMQMVVPPEDTFAQWLLAEYNNSRDLAAWILHQTPETAASDDDLRTLLTALRRRENIDPEWASFWLRSSHHTTRTLINCRIADYAEFINIMALRTIGASEQAHDALEPYLADDAVSPVMWLLMADCCIDLGRYGIAVHAIERASERTPSQQMPLNLNDSVIDDGLWKRAILFTRHRLGHAALARTMRNPVIEPALLELAMSFGDAQTIAEAALCWFDAALPATETPAQALANAPKALEHWILSVSARRDTDHLDKLYDFCQKLSQVCGDVPELGFLEALCQIDNPAIAAQTLTFVVRKLPHRSRLQADALSLLVELLAGDQAYDEAVNMLIPYLEDDTRDTRRILVELMARMPREALPMLQTMMCEQLGRDKTLSIFERLRKPDTEPQPPISPECDNPWPELELCLLPVAHQLLYRAARIGAKPADTAKAARRESVLNARGMRTKTFDNPPEPAQWVHSPQHLASDAFKS